MVTEGPQDPSAPFQLICGWVLQGKTKRNGGPSDRTSLMSTSFFRKITLQTFMWLGWNTAVDKNLSTVLFNQIYCLLSCVSHIYDVCTHDISCYILLHHIYYYIYCICCMYLWLGDFSKALPTTCLHHPSSLGRWMKQDWCSEPRRSTQVRLWEAERFSRKEEAWG